MKIKPFFDNLFSRWSFNLLALMTLGGIISPYLFLAVYAMFTPDWVNTDGLPLAISWFYFIIFYLIIVFFILFIYLFLERSPIFRIKNPLVLKCVNKIFYRITAGIFALLGCIILGIILSSIAIYFTRLFLIFLWQFI